MAYIEVSAHKVWAAKKIRTQNKSQNAVSGIEKAGNGWAYRKNIISNNSA
ncbi:hypothetical protein SDC9_104194 [bioreactor metagenome]|uniref:Uncharacterized protein n=1 Tax=bioreactor metagenome TaxID=1076179 RepID=A0A645AVV0_9ZZZZ